MCGITGYFFSKNPKTLNSSVIQKMTNALAHRGPDASGFFQDENCSFGHRRLSIIDLSANANQPFFSEDKNLVLVFNGEIFNYQDIREKLALKGIRFFTQSDTEVLLKAYQFWGENCLQHFNGFFAFAIYNKTTKSLFLARDRMGIKPLFYYHDYEKFAFTSELKSLFALPFFTKKLSPKGINSFIQKQHLPENHSVFENTFKLLPGHWLTFDKNGLKTQSYWHHLLAQNVENNQFSTHDYQLKVHDLLRSSVKYRMIADVEVGAFLSGGVDSSLLVALMKEQRTDINTFSIGFEEKKYDESEYAQKVAKHLGTNHHQLIVNAKMGIDLINQLPEIYDEPFADASAIPTFLVSEFAAKKVKVVLSGDGADELFGGYNRYQMATKIFQKISNIPDFAKRFAAISVKNLPISKHKRLLWFINQALTENSIIPLSNWSHTNFIPNQLNLLFTPQFAANYVYSPNLYVGFKYPKTNNNWLRIIDLLNYLPNDILTKVDRATMANGLEARVPFLDHRLVELALQIPVSFNQYGNHQKIMLKNILKNYVPEKLFMRPKMGFEIPLKAWLTTELKPMLEKFLGKAYLKNQGIFNANAIEQQLNIFEKNKANNTHAIWTIFMFQLWYNRWILNE